MSASSGAEQSKSVGKGVAAERCGGIDNIMEDQSWLDSLAVKDLRSLAWDVGIPGKGTKKDLVAALKCFVRAQQNVEVKGKVSYEPWTLLAHKKPQAGWVPYNPRTMRPPSLIRDENFVNLMSWNVNGLRALLKLESFSALQLAQPEDFDVLCLQETKIQEKDVEVIKKSLIDGYDNSFWTCSVSKLGYSGTAIISRVPCCHLPAILVVPTMSSIEPLKETF